MKASPLKIPYAIRAGQLVHISEVENGLQPDCVCPACASPLVARKGSLKVHHFAHAAESNCQPETVMHLLGKKLLAEKVEATIRDGVPLRLSWICEECRDHHEIDLVANIVQVAVEHDLGALRPDVALLNMQHEPAVILEVVVTHPPDAHVIAYCAERKIPVFEFKLKKMGDLEALRDSPILSATASTFCPRPKCEKCGHSLQPRKLFVVPGTCWNCHSKMMGAYIDCEGYTLAPSQMTTDEIAKANALGAFIKENFSRTMKAFEMSNTCPTCGLLTGNFYIGNFAENAEGMPGIQTGLGCVRC